MRLIEVELFKEIVADEGKHIRSKTDVFIPEHTDAEGVVIPAYYPSYTTHMYVPKDYTEGLMYEYFVEEEIEEETEGE